MVGQMPPGYLWHGCDFPAIYHYHTERYSLHPVLRDRDVTSDRKKGSVTDRDSSHHTYLCILTYSIYITTSHYRVIWTDYIIRYVPQGRTLTDIDT